MDYQEAKAKLKRLNQMNLLAYWEKLSTEEQESLLRQIKRLDLAVFKKQAHPPRVFEPLVSDSLAASETEEDVRIGKELLAAGEAGCLIVAGGQGSRLRFDGPKGCVPVTVFKQKSLFQVFAEKTAAASRQAGRRLPLAIMTSPANHAATRRFFEEHGFFGLHSDQVSFFMQGSLPLLDKEEKLFLESPGKIAEGPDGNGGALARFVSSGIWKEWVERGVRYLNYVPVDNPLSDPFDARLLGNLKRTGSQVVIKAIERLDVEEKVGVLVRANGQIRVVEYSELPISEARAVGAAGKPKYGLANISLFAFTMDFVRLAAGRFSEMPIHKAFKASHYLNSLGEKEMAATPNAWKFETFIFDVLEFAQNIGVLLFKREECFAPLKSMQGEGSLEAVQRALQNRDRVVIKGLTGIEASIEPFELAQDFYYPTAEISAAWKGKKLNFSGYVAV